MEPGKSKSHTDWESLIAEGPWLRRLAAALVGRDQADDLAQEVVVQALGHQPPEEPLALRAWLRTVAKRLAGRRVSREQNRHRAENRAAKGEATEDRTRDRLELHMRLTKAILDLDPPYRSVLTMRYLEDKGIAEIAEEFGLTEVATRKRISRGLEKLRKDLDREFSSRAGWHGALAFTFGDLPRPPAPVAVAALPVLGGTLFSLVLMKKVVMATVVLGALAVGYPWITKGWQGDLKVAQEEASAVEPAQAPGESVDRSQPVVAEVDAGQRQQIEAPVGKTARGGPWVRVQDAAGQTPQAARLVRVDRSGNMAELQLDGLGRAPIGDAVEGTRFVGKAEGHSCQGIVLQDPGTDLILTLDRAVTLTGRVFIDRKPAQSGLDLQLQQIAFSQQDLFEGLDRGQVIGNLKSLKMLATESWTVTQAGGAFSFAGVDSHALCRVLLSDSYRVSKTEGTRRFFYPPTEQVEIYATRQNYLRGRIAWLESSDPFDGSLLLEGRSRISGSEIQKRVPVAPSGAFEVGLWFAEEDDPDSGLEWDRVVLRARQKGGPWQDFSFDLDLGTVPRDVGVLRVARHPSCELVVQDEAGMPVEGACLLTDNEIYHSDSEGKATMVVPEGAEVLAMAVGYSSQKFMPKAQAAGVQTVTLLAGSALEIHTGMKTRGQSELEIPRVRVQLPGTYVERHSIGASNTLGLVHSPFVGSVGRITLLDKGAVSLEFSPENGLIRVPGLEPGELVSLSALDRFGNSLLEKEVPMPRTTGTHSVNLGEGFSGMATLVVDWDHLAGLDLEHARANLGTLGKGGTYRLTPASPSIGPLAPGRYTMTAEAPRCVSQFFPIELKAGENRQRIAMQPGREITFEFRSKRGDNFLPGQYRIEYKGGQVSRDGFRWTEKELVARAVPFVTGELVVRFGVEELRYAIDAEGTDYVFEAPDLGGLRLKMDDVPSYAEGSAKLFLSAYPVQASTALKPGPPSGEPPIGSFGKSRTVAPSASGTMQLEGPLEVGDYRVFVRWQQPVDGEIYTLLETTVTIQYGQTSTVKWLVK